MSNSLRSIVKKHEEENVLRKYLGRKYDTTSAQEKKKYLKAVDETIDRQVDLILKSFVEEIQKDSPDRKRRRNWALLLLSITVLVTPGIAYAVNIENWTLTSILSIILLAVQGYNVISGD